jgi:hypothetical protein
MTATMPVDGVAAAIKAIAREDIRTRARRVDRERAFPAEGWRRWAPRAASG